MKSDAEENIIIKVNKMINAKLGKKNRNKN